MVLEVRHLAVYPGTGGSSGTCRRNLSNPDLKFSAGQPVVFLNSLGKALKVLGPSWVRLDANKVLIFSGAWVGRLFLVHLRPVLSEA